MLRGSLLLRGWYARQLAAVGALVETRWRLREPLLVLPSGGRRVAGHGRGVHQVACTARGGSAARAGRTHRG